MSVNSQMPITEYVWTAVNGDRRRPALGEMTHRHILNTMRYIMRNAQSYASILSSTRGLAFRAGLALPDTAGYDTDEGSDSFMNKESSRRYVFGEPIDVIVSRGISKYQ